ncbi:MAG: hypothetical protein KatS3mg081_1854 [Gemmatimonadales bacterium]|nr:MAG: hypothetical protein KatS3mg081_1854 [Gemmatimonadales bacterium]
MPSPPRIILTWIRTLAAARRLGDADDSVEHLARQLGYEAPTALYNACQKFLRATPVEIRESGGLWFADRRLRDTVLSYRSRPAA